jgi:hypothetical protein
VQVTFSPVGVLSRKIMNQKKLRILILPNLAKTRHFTHVWGTGLDWGTGLKMKSEKFKFFNQLN